MDVIRVFERAVARAPERTFAFDAETTITYEQAHERSDAFARGFVETGLSPGDTLGLCAPDSVSLLLAIIGAWKAGLLPGLIDARTDDASLPYFVDDVGSKLILAPDASKDRLLAAGATAVSTFDDLPAKGGTVERQHGPDAPLYLSYTSGTTGAPKGAILRSGPVTLGTSCVADRLGINQDDVLLATTPTASSFQLVAALLPAIHTGASLGLVAGKPIAQIWQIARAHRATVLVAYPLTLADVVDASEATSEHTFRIALSGGSPLAPRIKRDYLERMGIPLLESYGQSELGGFMALGRPDDGARSLKGYVGRPLPDRPSVIGGVGADELGVGDVGEVVVPWGYFAGYRNKPEATDRALAGGVLHTGDLAVADPDGYLKVLGRTLEAEVSSERGGFLRQLEDAYYEHPSVRHAAVVAAADGGIEAFVELRDGAGTTTDELESFASAQVVPGLHPGRTTILTAMPRSFSGKADRLTLSRRSSG